MIKLSECTKAGMVFLYDGETVGLQYILRMIFNKTELPEIRLVASDKNFDDAVSNVLDQMYLDIQKGIEKDDYELNNLNTQTVEIDIVKRDIKQIGEYMFEIAE